MLGPRGHTDIQSIQEEPSCSSVGADWLERFWPVTGGEMVLVSETWKDLQINSSPTEQV